jgi:hypothetical protein
MVLRQMGAGGTDLHVASRFPQREQRLGARAPTSAGSAVMYCSRAAAAADDSLFTHVIHVVEQQCAIPPATRSC